MGFRIEKVELNNFRSHESFVFTPALGGVTALRGVNGSGKTSIVSAVPWCLYGLKPSGVSRNLDLRRKSTPKGEKTSVRVTLIINQDTYVVERRMRGTGSTEADLWRTHPNGELEHLAGQSVKDVTAQVQHLLGMDAAGFQTAVFFEQNKVDEFLHAKPEHRRGVLENLTGISGVSLAMEENKAHLRDTNTQIRGLSIDHVTLDEKKKKHAALTKQCAAARSTLETLEHRYAATDQKLTGLLNEYQQKNKAYNTRTALTTQAQALTTKTGDLDNRMKELAARRAHLKKTVALLDDTGDYATLKKAYETAENTLTHLTAATNNTTERIQQAETDLETATAAARPWETQEEAEQHLTATTRALEETQQEHSTTLEEIHAKQGLITSLTDAINSITSVTGECPTCHQSIRDKENVIAGLTTQRETAQQETEEQQQTLTKLTQTIENLNNNITTTQAAVEGFTRASETRATLTGLRDELKRLQKEKTAAEVDVNVHRDMYNEAKHTKNIKDELAGVNRDYQATHTAHTTATHELADIKETLSTVPTVTEKTLETLDGRITKGRGIAGALQQNIRDESNRVSVLTGEIAALEADISRDEAEAEKYRNLLKNQEALTHTLGVLSAFRQNVVDSSIPVMVSYASNLLGRFTRGAFVGVNIDSDFRVTATRADGSVTDVALLSGGEMSAVSMALGVAVSMMLSNSGGGLSTIIFDESFVSQDAGRVDSILSTIKDVCDGGQVILIAHNDNVEAIVDNIVSL